MNQENDAKDKNNDEERDVTMLQSQWMDYEGPTGPTNSVHEESFGCGSNPRNINLSPM